MTRDDQLQLSGPEQAWLTARRRDAELAAAHGNRARLVGPGRKVNGAAARYQAESERVAAAIGRASAEVPPKPSRRAGRRGSGPSDPTGAQVHATLDAVDRAAARFAHLLGPCADDDCTCQARDSMAGLIRELDGDYAPETIVIVDGLLGTPVTSVTAFGRSLEAARAAHEAAASRWPDVWHDARWTTDSDVLTDLADRTVRLAGRMRSLLASIQQWDDQARPVQRPLVYCRHHPDKLAKYPKLAKCEACYRADERRTG